MTNLDFWRGISTFLKRTYAMASPYWKSEHKGEAWKNLSGFGIIEIIQIYVLVEISYSLADFMDVLDARNFDDVLYTGAIWFSWVMAYVAFGYFQTHFRYHLMIGWRQFLTGKYLNEYLKPTLYHQIGLKDYDVDNPEQRIAIDIYDFTFNTLEVVVRFVSETIRAIVFGVVLWQVSGDLEFSIGDVELSIPGYMFWAALFYSAVVIYATHKVGKQLIPLNFKRQRAEADFRYDLVRLRENAESIALLHGELSEKKSLSAKFKYIRENWLDLLKYKKRLIIVQDTLSNLSSLFPYIAAMPAFVAGTIALGGFLQLRMSFLRVEVALTWIANSYEAVAQWKASVDRLLSLESALKTAEIERADKKLYIEKGSTDELKVEGMKLVLPNGDLLNKDISFNLKAGEHLVVTGSSGSGKSTLFRAISGLWVWGKGVVHTPNTDILFLPQKPYLPIGSMKEVLLYPNVNDGISEARLKRVMELCSLDKFVDRLEESSDWSKVLSGGEQQRVSFVRALIAEPSWLFLDESTSALDPKTEASIYHAIKRELPDTTIISIAHRESLKQYHRLELRLDVESQSSTLSPI